MDNNKKARTSYLCLTRRQVLGAATGFLLVGNVQSQTLVSVDRRTPLLRDSGESKALANLVASAHFEQLPTTTVTMTKRSILDALGVSMAAAGLEPACAPFISLALSSDTGGAVVLGTGKQTTPVMAALANGALAHALDYEDAHGTSFTHPNAATVAAAVSLASHLPSVSGKAFITAIAVGCDLVVRLALAQGNAGAPPAQFYPPAIVGTFGATAAACSLLDLNADQTLSALSLALCSNSASAAILFSPYSDIRAVRDGMCAQTGVQAALLAQHNVRGFDAPFEGQGGFFDIYAGGRYLPGELTRDLGTRFAGDDVGFKAWPACRSSHIYIQAILEGLQRDPVRPEAIESITVYVKESDLIICEPAAEKRKPRAAIDAKFSLYFVAATALVNGAVNLKSFYPQALENAELLQLAGRINYKLNPSQARPKAEGGGTLLTLTMRDGSIKQWGIQQLYGSPQYPMSDAALLRKFVDCGLASPRTFSVQRLEYLAEQLFVLEQCATIKPLLQSL